MPRGHKSFHFRMAEAAERQNTAIERQAEATAYASALADIRDVLSGYFAPASPRFVQILWRSTGNDLFGLKSDGTIWKAPASGDPLVWVLVSG